MCIRHCENNKIIDDLVVCMSIWSKLVHSLLGNMTVECSKANFNILFLLHRYGPMPMSAIGEKLNIAKPNITKLVDKLVEEAYVQRMNSNSDRRVTHIELTDSGRAFLQAIMSKLEEGFGKKIVAIDQQQNNEISHALRVLIDVGRHLT